MANGKTAAPTKPGVARLPRPKRSEKPVDHIPSGGGNTGFWAAEVPFLFDHPGETYVYENVGSSSVSTLRKTYGLDAVGRNTRKVDPDTLQPVDKDAPGTTVVDVYVTYRPELKDDILAGRESGKRGRPANTAPNSNGTA